MILLVPCIPYHILNRLGICRWVVSFLDFCFTVDFKLAFSSEPLRMENQSDVFVAHALSNSIKAGRVGIHGLTGTDQCVEMVVGFVPFIFDIS